ncbi:MAG: TonB-dependent receptor [Desulfovibrio sp.]
MLNQTRRGIAALALCLTMAVPGGALAEDTATEEKENYRLPTVIVTADKRATDVQKTPSSISVLTSEKLEDAKVDTIERVMQRVPNLNLSPFIGGASLMSFRGVTTSPGTATSPIVMYVDGVPVDTYFNLDAPLMNVERVEVLRGPQSAIYGKNAMGGVINVISRKPGNEWHGGIQTEYGSYNTFKVGGTVSGPIVEDKLFFSVSGQHNTTNGFMEHDDTSDGNRERTERIKGQLRFTPTKDTEFNFHINYTARRDGYSNAIWGDSPTLDSPLNDGDYLNTDILNMALTASVNFEPLILESITTFRSEFLDYACDMAFVYNPLTLNPLGASAKNFDTGRKNERKEFTQELRIKSPDSADGVNWLAGVFGGYTDMHIRSVYTDAKANNYPTGIPGFTTTATMYQNQPSHEYTQDYAAFGELSVPLTSKLRATGALRGQYTHKKINIRNDSTMSLPDFGITQQLAKVDKTHDDSWMELLPKFNLSYQFTDDVMMYAGVNRSFIPGGFNNVSSTGFNMKYDSQTAWNYELGTKTEWFDKKLQLNGALFYSTFNNLQVFKYDAGSGQYLSSNAGSARSYGFEVDALAHLLPGLDAEASFGYTNAKFDDYTHNGKDYSGNKVPYTPDYTASFALQYRHETGIFARGEVLQTGALYWSENNEEQRGDITLLNARIGYEYEGFGVYLYGNNLTNRNYLSYYTPVSNVGMMARPREIGVQAQYTF